MFSSIDNTAWMDEEDEQLNFDGMLTEVTKWSMNQNKFQFRQTVTHNLLLMGKTRTGKTTVAEVLADPCYVPLDAKLHSDTKEVTIHPVVVTMVHEDRIYCFNVVDTPGLYDKVKNRVTPLSNERIKVVIDECIKKDVTNMHLFAFVISLKGNVDTEDISSMKFIMKNYPKLHPHICLLVTHCEGNSAEQRTAKVKEFFESQTVVALGLKEFFGQNIYYMGSLRPELRTNPDKQCVRQQMRNILEMREKFLEYIISIDVKNSFNIHRLDVADPACKIL
ncbi:unnamed protein product [Adineta steineri]|uniref:AIG1-type G domain-containing protein n=1 Tax=Adineta steineri TaxID=433720 RepID=A0A816FC24_9BILA|nr:unnamed protein product [Adineta steineri]CAF1660004.1 unnamed protein product [Adineta steineri]